MLYQDDYLEPRRSAYSALIKFLVFLAFIGLLAIFIAGVAVGVYLSPASCM